MKDHWFGVSYTLLVVVAAAAVVFGVASTYVDPLLLAGLLCLGVGLTGFVVWQQRRVQLALRATSQTEAFYKSVVEQAGDGIALVEPLTNQIILHNVAFERLAGLTAQQTYEQLRASVQANLKRDGLGDPNDSAVVRQAFAGEHRLRRVDGVYVGVEIAAAMVSQGVRRLICLTVRDVSRRKKAEETVRQMAYHDALTGLPNRLLFADRLKVALARTKRSVCKTAVLFIDLDTFKGVNDTLGHDAGDDLLRQVAARLTAAVRESDTVARQGGDEFLVLLHDVPDVSRALGAGQRILDALRRSYLVKGRDVFTSASIGLALYPGDGDDAETLIRNADVAMYHAKDAGKNQCQLFNQEVQTRIAESMDVRNRLVAAVAGNEFLLYYQPKLETYTGKVSGVEALVRWNQPEKGLVSPALFIPIAEETGLIVQLGEWVLREACRQAVEWSKRGINIRVGVNLSGRQFRSGTLAAFVRQVLTETGLDPAQLDLEITESVAMQSPDQVRTTLEELRSLGVTISLDDFGTGYSSLSYLKQFPFDYLKIDRSFLHGVETDYIQRSMVGGIVSLAHVLKLRVIAEGVETPAQLDAMKDVGCDELQGYGFCQPLPAAELEKRLSASNGILSPLHAAILGA